MNALTLETLDIESLVSQQNLTATYKAIRPLLVVVSAFPLVSAKGQAAVKLFLALFDQIAEGTDTEPNAAGDFKAGKDQ
jgi:hypothetical protein